MMNREEFSKNLPSIEEVHKSGLQLLVVIVNRNDGSKITKFLKDRHFYLQFTCMAEGTRGSEIMDLLGLGSTDKTVVLCATSGLRTKTALEAVSEKLNLRKPGKGIAFTIPLSGVGLPDTTSLNLKTSEHLQEIMEDEVDKMNNTITHSIILAVVNQGNSEELVETANEAGAKGGTVINARRTGLEEVIKFFGMTVQPEKEIVAILTDRKSKPAIMDAINQSFGIDKPAHGIILSVPVDGIAGLNIESN